VRVGEICVSWKSHTLPYCQPSVYSALLRLVERQLLSVCAGTGINFLVGSQAIYISIIWLPLLYKLNAFSGKAIQHDKQCIQNFALRSKLTGALYQWAKLPVREADHSPPPPPPPPLLRLVLYSTPPFPPLYSLSSIAAQ